MRELSNQVIGDTEELVMDAEGFGTKPIVFTTTTSGVVEIPAGARGYGVIRVVLDDNSVMLYLLNIKGVLYAQQTITGEYVGEIRWEWVALCAMTHSAIMSLLDVADTVGL
jgi:hypothetical protein